MDSADWHHVEAALEVSPAQALTETLQRLGVEASFHGVLSELAGGRVEYLADIDVADLEGSVDASGASIPRPVARGLVRKLQGARKNETAVTPSDTCMSPDESQRAAPAGADASSAASAVDDATPVKGKERVEEVIAVCIDRSGSMGSPFSTDRTRMEAVKQMFYAFRDRTECLGAGKHEIGLLQFDSAVERLLEPTARLDSFEALVDRMEKRGSTAIFSALAEAAEMLAPRFQAEAGGCDLRILALTDGQNNAGMGPEEALERVNAIGAVVDAIIVGDRPDSNLRRIVSATGGECFQIRDLGEGFELLEAETAVSLQARRGAERPAFAPRPRVQLDAVQEKTMTKGSAVAKASVPVELAKAKVTEASKFQEAAGGPASSRRILAELRQLVAQPTAGIHVFPSENVRFWRALLAGPEGSPFSGGVFALTLEFPEDYPFRAPKIRFETPVYHCNVSDNGAICLDILQDTWSPALSVGKALLGIRELLVSPNTDDALRSWIAELTIAHQRSGGSDKRYLETAQQKTAEDAGRSVEDWKRHWGI